MTDTKLSELLDVFNRAILANEHGPGIDSGQYANLAAARSAIEERFAELMVFEKMVLEATPSEKTELVQSLRVHIAELEATVERQEEAIAMFREDAARFALMKVAVEIRDTDIARLHKMLPTREEAIALRDFIKGVATRPVFISANEKLRWLSGADTARDCKHCGSPLSRHDEADGWCWDGSIGEDATAYEPRQIASQEGSQQ